MPNSDRKRANLIHLVRTALENHCDAHFLTAKSIPFSGFEDTARAVVKSLLDETVSDKPKPAAEELRRHWAEQVDLVKTLLPPKGSTLVEIHLGDVHLHIDARHSTPAETDEAAVHKAAR